MHTASYDAVFAAHAVCPASPCALLKCLPGTDRTLAESAELLTEQQQHCGACTNNHFLGL